MDGRDLLRITFGLLSLLCSTIGIAAYFDFKKKLKQFQGNVDILDTGAAANRFERIVTQWANISIAATIAAAVFGLIAVLILHEVI